jgi:peptide/nickel transport system substrate-binding protein
MKKLVLATGSVGMLLLTACGGAAAPDSGVSGQTSASGIELVSSMPAGVGPVDNVNWNLADGEPLSLDPNLSWSGSQNFVGNLMCESLLSTTPTGGLEPGLATDVSYSDDKTLIVKLREGVTFWDGSAVTADDVAFSIERARTNELSQFAGDLASVASVEATDATTVTIALSEPNSLVRSALSTGAAAVVSKASAEGNADFGLPGNTSMVCSGPYTLKEWTAGTKIVVEANPNWWNKGEGKQLTKQITFSFITDPAAAVAGYESGELDGGFLIPASSIKALQASTVGKMGFAQGSAFAAWVPVMNSDRSMSNPKLRQALAMSLDYASLVDTETAGAGIPAKAVGVPGSWGNEKAAFQEAWDALPDQVTDLEAAKKLVAESGVSNPELVIQAWSELPDSVNQALVLQQAANSVGFNATILKVGFDRVADIYSSAVKTDIDIFGTTYLSIVSDPLSIYSQIGLEAGFANWGGYSNAEVNELVKSALATTDDAERAKITIEIQKLIVADYAWLPTTTTPSPFFISNELSGVVPAAPAHLWSAWAVNLGTAK